MDSTQNGRDSAAIFQEHLKTVYHIAYTYLGNSQDAEEAVQRTFSKLLRSDESFEAKSAERSWLISTVMQVCFKMLDKRHGDSGEAECPDKTIKAMVALPDKIKAAAYLFYCEGCTSREIAELLDDKPNAVSAMVDKARRQLKVRLGGDFDD